MGVLVFVHVQGDEEEEGEDHHGDHEAGGGLEVSLGTGAGDDGKGHHCCQDELTGYNAIDLV